MIRKFYSKEPYSGFKRTEQTERNNMHGKPNGVWYECDGSWIEWAKYEMPEWIDGYNYENRIEVNLERMVVIRNLEELNEFEAEYGEMSQFGETTINWIEVAEDYDGIEICPYISGARYKRWYYGWDVASGCVWSKKAINSVVTSVFHKELDSEDDSEDDSEEIMMSTIASRQKSKTGAAILGVVALGFIVGRKR